METETFNHQRLKGLCQELMMFWEALDPDLYEACESDEIQEIGELDGILYNIFRELRKPSSEELESSQAERARRDGLVAAATAFKNTLKRENLL